MNTLKEQYKLIKESRSFVMKYLTEIETEKLQQRMTEFKKNSIVMILVHTANTHIYWIANFGLQKDMKYFEDKNDYTIGELSEMFSIVDTLMDEFIQKYSGDFSEIIEGYNQWSEKNLAYPALQVFTHAVMHEFHHKGQLMSISSLLGYTPPDADIIRF